MKKWHSFTIVGKLSVLKVLQTCDELVQHSHSSIEAPATRVDEASYHGVEDEGQKLKRNHFLD